MTERKPPGVPFESWVDRQIREATERGEFDDLPGEGKPLPGLDKPYDELWWVKEKMAREQLSVMPPSMVVRKEAEDALAAVARASTEKAVREIVAGINAKILEALRAPSSGPPLNLTPFDVEEIVRDWRERRAQRGRRSGD